MTSWLKMKQLFNAWFLPLDFKQWLFQQYQECRQGARTVQAYVDDFYQLSAQNDFMETKAQQVAQFIGGLHLPIEDKVSMQHVFTLTKAVSLATPVEKQLERPRALTWEQNPGNPGRSTEDWGKQLMLSTETIVQRTTPRGRATRGSSS